MKTQEEIEKMLKDLKISFIYHSSHPRESYLGTKKDAKEGRIRTRHEAETICWVLEQEWYEHKEDFKL